MINETFCNFDIKQAEQDGWRAIVGEDIEVGIRIHNDELQFWNPIKFGFNCWEVVDDSHTIKNIK